MAWLKQNWYRLGVHLAALTPLALMIFDTLTGRLSYNPIQDLTFWTGKTGLILLVLSLLCTPLNMLFGWRWAIKLRRPLGLYGFMYIAIHLFIFAVVDYGLDWNLIAETIAEKRYVLVGFSAFLLLLPLAITSTKGWQRRLGKGWKKLHRLVYLAIPLGVVHFVWLVKSDIREPLAYGAAVAVLLALRIPVVRRSIVSLRQRISPPRARPRPQSIEPKQSAVGSSFDDTMTG